MLKCQKAHSRLHRNSKARRTWEEEGQRRKNAPTRQIHAACGCHYHTTPQQTVKSRLSRQGNTGAGVCGGKIGIVVVQRHVILRSSGAPNHVIVIIKASPQQQRHRGRPGRHVWGLAAVGGVAIHAACPMPMPVMTNLYIGNCPEFQPAAAFHT